ncbi:PepSY domain-containing protein [Nocardioides euryhalodurans]|nr:PepSY domain-containing protein [Nocardioides euryhalodurans]
MDMNLTPKRIAVVLGATAVLTLGAVGGAYALTGGDDDRREQPIPAADLEQAEQAALEETGGGTVTETEVDDEESKYEVEVSLEDGTQVDVQLDTDFQVVGTEDDGTDDESDGE